MIFRITVIAGLITFGIADAEPQPWRMKDGKVIEAELRCAWGEGDAAIVDFIIGGTEVLTMKRSELHPDDAKRISPPELEYDDYRFAWSTAHPVSGQPGQVKITYRFQRTVPGVKGCDEASLIVAPFKIGNALIPPDAWEVSNLTGPDGAVMDFHTTGAYDASKLIGSKFSASLEMEVGKGRKRAIQQIDLPKRAGQEVKSNFGDIEIKAVYLPALGEGVARSGVLVRSEPKEKLISYLMESRWRVTDAPPAAPA
jgi:hypothetical protein